MGVAVHIQVSPQHLSMIKDLLHTYIPNTPVWAFGSRVKGAARPSSDLDLVAFIGEEQKPRLSELKEALEESNVPFRIDLHSWNELPDVFKHTIEQEYAVVQEADSDLRPSSPNWGFVNKSRALLR